MATWNTEVLAEQNGGEQHLSTGATNITYYDVIRPESGVYTTKFKAIGTTGNEIGFVYKVSSDGTFSHEFKQVETPTSAGEFAYASSTKTITFSESDADRPQGDDYIACAYTFRTAANAQKITVTADGIPPTVLVSAYGLARDICNGVLFPCVIEGTAQVDGNWSFDLSADGEPVVQNLSMEFVKSCLSNDLYTFTVFTEDESDEGE